MLKSKNILFILGVLASAIFVVSITEAHTTVLYDPFQWAGEFDPYDQPDSDYFYYMSLVPEPFFADDGEIINRRNSTHTLDITPFEKTVSKSFGGSLDHTKNLILAKQFFAISAGQKLRCELNTKTEILHANLHPFGDLVDDFDRDIRLGACGLTMIDFNTWTAFHLLQTNRENHPAYQRLPNGQGSLGLGPYQAFIQSKSGVSERWHDDYNNLAIEYDRSASTVEWSVDGSIIHSISDVGVPDFDMVTLLDNGGNATEISLSGALCGFGCYTLMDGSNPLNDTSTEGLAMLVSIPGYYEHPTSFNDTSSDLTSRVFGQGAIASRKRFKVSIHTSA